MGAWQLQTKIMEPVNGLQCSNLLCRSRFGAAGKLHLCQLPAVTLVPWKAMISPLGGRAAWPSEKEAVEEGF